MKIWVDDIRTPPDDTWEWVKTSQEAIDLLESICEPGMLWVPLEKVSLDHVAETR